MDLSLHLYFLSVRLCFSCPHGPGSVWVLQTPIMVLLRSLVFLGALAAAVFAVPAQEKRVHRQADLSDHAHDDSHGYQYDHEAFLGKEEAKTFDQLTPEESKDRLA